MKPAVAAALLLAGCQPVPAPAPRDDSHAPATTTAAPLPPPPPPTASATAAPAVEPPPHLVVLGDSLTDPKSHGGGFLDVLRERCPGLTVANYAKGGFMMNQIRRRFTNEVLPTAATSSTTHLVIFGGVNDLYSDETAGRTVEKIQADFRYLFEQAKAQNWKIVVLTVAPWGGFRKYDNPRRRAATKRLNRWLLDEASAGRITALETGPLLTCGDPEVLCRDVEPPYKDGIHFGAKGHERIGEALWKLAFSSCAGAPKP